MRAVRCYRVVGGPALHSACYYGKSSLWLLRTKIDKITVEMTGIFLKFYIGWLGTSIDIEATTDAVHGGSSFESLYDVFL